MSMQVLSRCGAVLFFVVLVSGCSTSGAGDSQQTTISGRVVDDDCRWNRSSCLYEGSYETGERDYAEEEAKRLNRAASRKLRGGSWW